MFQYDNKLTLISEYVLQQQNSDEILADTAIIIYLYYEDTLDMYLDYIDNIPEKIKVVIITSNSTVKNIIEKWKSIHNKKFEVRLKENRGRDISALLVTAKDITSTYKYVCFIHDKKEHSKKYQKEIQFWLENLWDNALKSSIYIQNVICMLEKNSDLGILIPPPKLNLSMEWDLDYWEDNIENVQKLAEKLGIAAKIKPEDDILCIGTVFWCKTSALKKLFGYNWKIEDFDQEPLKINGTISHAVERIFPYAAKDEGYKTKFCICLEYAEKLITIQNNILNQSFAIFKEIGLENVDNIYEYENLKCKCTSYFVAHKKVYLYGAGKIGKLYLKFAKHCQCEPAAFLETVKNPIKNNKDMELPVIALDDIKDWNDCGIIITVGDGKREELENILYNRGIKDYIYYLYQ